VPDTAISRPGLCGDGLGRDDAAARDLIQPGHGRQHRGAGAGAGARAGGAVGVGAPRGGDLLDQPGYPGGQGVDLGGQGVDLVQQDAGQLAVVRLGLAVRRPGQGGALGPRPADGQVRQGLRVALPGDQRLDQRPGGVGVRAGATAEILISARSGTFPGRARYRVRSCTRPARSRVNSGTNHGGSMPRPVSLASHTASFLPVFARPGTFLTDRGAVQLHRQPGSLQHHPPDAPAARG
jgi:hypothetical protein